MQMHIWSEGIAAETSRTVDETEAALKRFRDEGILRIDPRSGDLVGRWSAMGDLGEDIRAVLRRNEEENKREREARRQARREALALEREEEAS
jgi:hypothetical protein